MKKAFLILGLALGACLLVTLPGSKAYANSVNYNDVISDPVFDDTTTMNTAQIDAFLNTFPNSCISTNNGFSSSDPTGYSYSTGFRFGGNVSAGTVIYHAAQVFDMNPQVLLTTLQKEQSLVSGSQGCYPNTPDKSTAYPCNLYNNGRTYNCTHACPYNGGCIPIAVGYGCPGQCNADQEGFSSQIIRAAWRLSFDRHRAEGQTDWYIDKPNWDNSDDLSSCYNGPMTQGTWSRGPSTCGSGYFDGYYTTLDPASVHIDNGATAALYHYTPFLHGQSLFYNIFVGWFGSPNGVPLVSDTLKLTGSISVNPSAPVVGESPTISFTVQNTGSTSASVQNTILQCRYKGTSNCDSALGGAFSLQAGEQKTFTYTLSPLKAGWYIIAPYVMQNGIWYKYANPDTGSNTIRLDTPSVSLISPIKLSPNNPVAGETAEGAYTFKNTGSTSVKVQKTVFQCRVNVSTNCDSTFGGSFTLEPGQEKTFNTSLGAIQPGSYVFTPYFMVDNVWYRYGKSTTINNTVQYSVPDVVMQTNVSISPASPIPGQALTVTYSVVNNGSQAVTYDSSLLQCRINSTTNCDVPISQAATINAGAQRDFSVDLGPVKAGTYTLTPYYYLNNTWYRYGIDASHTNSLKVVVPKYIANMSLLDGISITPANPVPGQTVTATYTVKNYGDKPAILQHYILQCRLNTTTNCDPSKGDSLTIDIGQQHTFTQTFTWSKAGTYVLKPYFMQNDHWWIFGPTDKDVLKVVVN